MKRKLLALVATTTMCLSAFGVDSSFERDFNAVRSELQSMGGGYYTQEEWDTILGRLDGLQAQAEKAQDHASIVEITVLKAQALSDMRGKNEEALQILADAKTRYARQPPPNYKKIYMQMSRIYARLGNEEAIRKLMKEFEQSSAYDPDQYPYSVANNRSNTTITITRPSPRGSDSLTITAMEKERRIAQLEIGTKCPDFLVADTQGNSIKPSDYRGKVLLIDFWNGNSTPWQRQLPYLAQIYKHYKDDGFTILGVRLDRDSPNELLKRYKADWPQVVNNPQMAEKFGIYGQGANFLVNPDGVIIGRNLSGSDLIISIRKALKLD